jgi:hypothetical protein
MRHGSADADRAESWSHGDTRSERGHGQAGVAPTWDQCREGGQEGCRPGMGDHDNFVLCDSRHRLQ